MNSLERIEEFLRWFREYDCREDDESLTCENCKMRVFCDAALNLYDELDLYEDYDDDDITNPLYDPDYCYECGGYGDDYYINDDGELECRCFDCPFGIYNNGDD